MRGRKTLAILLTLLMLLTMSPVSAAAAAGEQVSRFADMKDNWSSAALNQAVDNGLLKGYETGGKTLIKAGAPLKRAEMAAIVNRAFGAKVTAELKGVNDVSSSAWYAGDMAKAVQMGTFVLSTKMRPESNITRQEAFTVLARAFKLTSADTAFQALEAYSDKDDIASWAKSSLNALAAEGYIKGSPDGKLNPGESITRAEFAVVMSNLVNQYIDKPVEVTQITADGNVMVRAAGATLKNVTIKGDLIIADGVGNGEVMLDGIKVEGRTVIRGGGINSIIIRGNSSIGTVIIARADGAVSVKVQGDANVEVIYIDDGSDDVKLEGNLGEVEVKASNITVSTVGANIGIITVSGDSSRFVIDKDSKIENLSVDTKAASTRIEVAGTVGTITTQAAGTAVTGSGRITKVEAKEGADNTRVETSNTQITVGSGVTGVTGGGGSPVGSGNSVTNNTDGTGVVSTTSGGGGGGSTVPVSAVSVSGEGNAAEIATNNGTLQMTAAVEPANASNISVTWSVANGTGEAIINTTGLLTAVKNGTVTVKATAKDGSGKFGEKEISISGQVPLISTASTIANGAVNPSVVVTLTKDIFTADGISNLSANWTGTVGTTGLTGGTITRNSDTQMTFQLNGTAQAGSLTLQADAEALTGGVASNTITITVPEAPVTVTEIDTASVEMRKGSIIMGFTFLDAGGEAVTYTEVISDSYALDEDASTVKMYKSGIQIGNTVKLNQLSISDSDTVGESGKVTFADFTALLTTFGLDFSNPGNIPDKVKIDVCSKTTIAGKEVANPWGPIIYEEPVSSDLYMDLDVDAAMSSATILTGNKTAGQAFPIAITLKDAAGANLPNGDYMVEISNGATPVGGGSITFTDGQASVNALLASAGSFTLTVKVSNVEVDTIDVTLVSSPVLGSIATTIDGTAIHLTFDKAMADPAGKHGQFAVTVNGSGVSVTAAELKTGESETIVLTLASPLAGSETITIAYTQGTVVAADNGILCTFTPMPVTNNVLPDQDGAPAFTAGIPATFGTEITVGSGTLIVTTGLNYSWYRSDDANYNAGSDALLGTGTTYTPAESDIGKYLIVVATTADAAGIGVTATAATVEKAAGPAVIPENFAGTFPSAATSINLSGFAASASGLEAAAAIDGSLYASYADLAVNGDGEAVITGLTGVTESTKVKVRVKETSTHKVGAEKEAGVTEEIVDAVLTPDTVSFDLNTEAQADVTSTITWNSAAGVTAVKNGGTALTENTDYTVAVNTLTVKKEYLAEQSVGDTGLSVEFDKGSAATFTITVTDTTPVVPAGDLLDAASGSDFTGALYARTGALYYSQADSTGVWGTETQITGAASEGKMTVDNTGNPHVVYTTSDGKIGYRMYDGASWTSEVLIESNYGGTCSKPDIAVDQDGYARIVYKDTLGTIGNYTDAVDIMYATNASGSLVKTLIYNGYFEDYGGASGHGEYYDKDAYISVDSAGNNYIFTYQRIYDKWMGGSDTTHYLIVKSDLGNGNISNYKYDIFGVYGLTSGGGKVVALYGQSGFKAAELTESGGTISFTGPQDLLGTNVSSVSTDGTNIVVGGTDTGKLQIYANGTQTVYNDIAVKGYIVSVMNSGGSFYAAYTDNTDGKIKLLEIAP